MINYLYAWPDEKNCLRSAYLRQIRKNYYLPPISETLWCYEYAIKFMRRL